MDEWVGKKMLKTKHKQIKNKLNNERRIVSGGKKKQVRKRDKF